MIILKQIHLEHFMTIDQLDLEIPENCMIAIAGDNGAGKSTLLYAFAFCIANYKKGEKFESYIKTGYNLAKINMTALLRGVPVTYEIEIPRPTGKTTSLPVKRKVTYKGKTYLNNDYSQFMKEFELEHIESLMFLFQGSNQIIDARPSERADALRRLFNFEFSDIVEKLKEKQEQNKTVNLEINAVLQELKSRIYEKQQLFRVSPLETIQAWEQELKEIETTLVQLAGIDQNQLKKVLDDLNGVNTAITNALTDIRQRETGNQGLETEIQARTEEINAIDINKIQTEKDSWKQKYEEHEAAWKTTKETVETLTQTLRIRNHDLEELSKQLEISRTGICHACGQSISETYVTQLERKYSVMEEKVDSLTAEIASYNFDPRDIEGTQITAQIQKCQKLLEKRTELEQLNKNASDRLTWSRNTLNADKDRLKTLEERQADLKKEQARLEQFSSDFARKNELETRRQTLKSQIENAKAMHIKNSERRIANGIIEKDQLARDQKVHEYSEKLNNTLLQMNTTKASIDILENQFPNFLVLKAAQMLEEHINLIIRRVFPEMQVKLSQQRTGVNFYYKTHEDDTDWLSISMASGAEAQILALAYSISLARLAGLDCLLLDEIDASMTEENAGIIYTFIAGLDCFKQIIFISHKKEAVPAVKEINPNIISYFVNDGTYSLLD